MNFRNAQTGYRRKQSGRHWIKQLGGRQTLAAARDHLDFLDHVHELDALQGGPGRTKGFEPQFSPTGVSAFSESGLPFRRELLDPAVDVRVVDRNATFFHDLYQMLVTERISQVPANTSQDDVFFDVVSLFSHAGNLGGVRWTHSLPKL